MVTVVFSSHPTSQKREEAKQAAREDAEFCAQLVKSALSQRSVFRLSAASGSSREVKRFRAALRDAVAESRALAPTKKERMEGKRDLRGNRHFIRYAHNCCGVFEYTGLVSADEFIANPRLKEAVLTRLKLQYERFLELGIAPSVISRRLHRYSLDEATRRVDLCRRLFGGSPSSAPLVQTAIYRLFSGSYNSPSAAHQYYRKQLALCKSELPPEFASLARTAAFLIFSSRFKDFASARTSLQDSFQSARSVFGDAPELRVFARTAAREVFLGRSRSVGEFKRRFDAVAPEVRGLFGKDDDTRDVTETALHLVLTRKYRSAAEALTAYRKALTQCSKEFERIEGGSEIVRTAARLVFDKSYADASEARRAYSKIEDESARLAKRRPLISGMERSLAYSVFAKRFSSVESAGAHLERLIKKAGGEDANSVMAPYARMIASSVFRGAHPSIEAAARECRNIVAECQWEFGQEAGLRRFARTAVSLVFGRRYRSVPEAKAALVEYSRIATAQVTEGRLPQREQAQFTRSMFMAGPRLAKHSERG